MLECEATCLYLKRYHTGDTRTAAVSEDTMRACSIDNIPPNFIFILGRVKKRASRNERGRVRIE